MMHHSVLVVVLPVVLAAMNHPHTPAVDMAVMLATSLVELLILVEEHMIHHHRLLK
jgi:hypothetical protein